MLRSIALLVALCQAGDGDAPLSPAEELARFTLPPGFSAELVAADPDIAKVVDIAFDDAGRMWAVTAVEYPVDGNETAGAEELYRGGGRDRVLVFDTPTAAGVQIPRTFADGLALPLTVLPTSDGVLVGQGPDILWLRDRDGDGVADRRNVVLTGFGIQDSHLMPHRLTRGPGNWIYMAQGAFNYSQVKTKKGVLVPFDQCKLGRFKADGSHFEVVGWGLNNIWGFVIDARGEMFVQEANDLGYPVVPFHLGASYPGIGMHRARPYSPWQPPLADFSMGGTGLSGLAQSEDTTGFPEPWSGAFFVANPIVSRVQAIRVHPDGPRHRLEKLDDFLVSADPRFRPIAIHYGPDGCLYVVDWYNKIISHNEVPRDHPERDKTRGRIWRIRHESQPRRAIPDVSAAETSALVGHLQAPTLWEARAAWHQIVDRKAVELVDDLEALVRDAKLAPRVRVLAIWCLRDLGRLDTRLANRVLRDADRDIRRETVSYYEDDTVPEVGRLPMLQMMTRETDPQVRLATIRAIAGLRDQATYLVRFLLDMVGPPPEATPEDEAPATARSQQSGTKILTGAAGERAFERSLIRAALEEHRQEVLAFLGSQLARNLAVEQRLMCWLAIGGPQGALGVAGVWQELERAPTGEELALLGREVADPEVAQALAQRLSDPQTQAAVVALLIDTRERVDRALLAAPLAVAVRDLVQREPAPESWALFVGAASAFAIAELEPELVTYARDPARTRAEQARALRALIEIRSTEAQLFADLARGCLPGEELQHLAAVALAGCDDEDAFALLIELWPNGSSAVQRAAVRELASSAANAVRLLRAIEAGDIEAAAIDPVSLELLGDTLGEDPALGALRARLVTSEVLVLAGAPEDYLQTGLTLEGPFTVETWIKLEPGVSNADGILGIEGGADFNFAAAHFRIYAGPNQGDKIIAERKVEAGTWTHIAVTRDGQGNLLLYQNGELDPARGSYSGPLEDLDVGRTAPAAGTAGQLTGFRVWKVARSAAEIGGYFRRRIDAHPELVFRFPGAASTTLSGSARIEKSPDAPELLDDATAEALAAKFDRYRGLAAGPGDAARGRGVFARDCARCHTVGGEGGQIGPVLDGAGRMGTESLLRSLITPNSAVESGYRTLLVRTTDGQLHDGFLASQDDEQLILRKPDVEDRILPRSSIESAWFDRLSVMPEDLLEALSEDEVRDLFAYLLSLE